MTTETVRIVRFHEIGSPDVLQLDELPLTEPGKGEIRLWVKAIGLNRAEAYFRQDQHPVFTSKLPAKIGFEASGVVEAVGPGVDFSWLGKTASTVPAFPADAYGVYGEVAIVPVNAVAEYPAHLSYEEGASIWMRYITAYGALIHQGRLKGLVALAAAAAPSGIIFEYGILADDPTPYPLVAALRKNLTIKGYSLFEVKSNREEFLRAKKYVFDHVTNGDFRPIISRTFPISDIVEARRFMESNAQIGKIVVTV